MKKKTLLIVASALLVFACFYAVRERWFRNYLNDAESSYSRNETDEALTGFLFASALDENGSDETMRVRRAEIFFENKEWDAAERELTPLFKADTKNYEAYELLGRVEAARGNFGKADAYFAQVCGMEVTLEKVLLRAKNLVRGGESSRAADLLRAERRTREDDELDYYLALIAFNEDAGMPDLSGRVDGGYADELGLVEAFDVGAEPSADMNPDYRLVRKADLFNRLKETDFAFAAESEVLRRNADYPDALIVRGETLMIENDFAGAAAEFEKCVDIDVNNEKAYSWLAKLYDNIGDGQKAAAYREKYEYLKN